MDILVLGDEARAQELMKRIPKRHQVRFSTNINDASFPKYNLIFDLNFDDDPINLQYYSYLRNKIVVVGAVKTQLADALANFRGELKCKMLGMNTLPGFLDRDLMELSLLKEDDKTLADQLKEELDWDYKIVSDRVGMVTPRVVFMIINEACYTLQEGTASVNDIDTGMKLGTNYPYGPFEWADRIGVKDVYQTLVALYADTHDERYKICPLLKTKYLKREPFY